MLLARTKLAAKIYSNLTSQHSPCQARIAILLTRPNKLVRSFRDLNKTPKLTATFGQICRLKEQRDDGIAVGQTTLISIGGMCQRLCSNTMKN